MSTEELIGRLTDLIKLQADIIERQAASLAQLNAFIDEEIMAEAASERKALGISRESGERRDNNG